MPTLKKQSHAEWSTADINDLPDSSFAYIEDGGKKDADGKTTPRSLRHLPYKDKDGKVDLPHVRNALARLDATKIPADAKAGIKKKLEAILQKSKASEKHMGVFPLEFDDDGDESEDDSVAVPNTIHVVPIGSWQHDQYGPISVTASDVREFVQNFNMKVRNGVFITAGHEGFQELPAVGWFTKLEARDDGLWGDVEWNENGLEALQDKQFKFFSPEFYPDYEDPQDHQIYRNVLTGGALTKSPYFKELEAIVFSEPKFSKKFNETATMELKDLLEKKLEELSEAEKSFIKEHAAELTDEQKSSHASVLEEVAETAEEKAAREKAEADKAAEEKAAADKAAADAAAAAGGDEGVKGSEKVQISAAEYNLLKKQADQGATAFAELAKSKLDMEVKNLMFSESNKAGKFLPKSESTLRAFVEKLSAEQRTQFSALLKELPKTQIFDELGTGAAATEGTAEAEMEAKTKHVMSENKDMKYADALKKVLSENPGLTERYNTEIQQKTK